MVSQSEIKVLVRFLGSLGFVFSASLFAASLDTQIQRCNCANPQSDGIWSVVKAESGAACEARTDILIECLSYYAPHAESKITSKRTEGATFAKIRITPDSEGGCDKLPRPQYLGAKSNSHVDKTVPAQCATLQNFIDTADCKDPQYNQEGWWIPY